MTAPLHFDSFDLYGAKITPTTIDDLLGLLDTHVAGKQQCVVASQNMHGLRVRLDDDAVRGLHSLPQTYVHIDGMPLVALCRLRGIRASRQHRVTLVDFVWPLLTLAEQRGWRVYYLGGSDSVVKAGSARMRARLPGLTLRARNGYFSGAAETAAIAHEIAEFKPDLVLVGMGMGRQERWILDNLAAFAPASVVTMGACMEYVSGAVGTPPRWMGRTGLEWLYRFAENPGRFWSRYLVEPWVVLAHITWYSLTERRQ